MLRTRIVLPGVYERMDRLCGLRVYAVRLRSSIRRSLSSAKVFPAEFSVLTETGSTLARDGFEENAANVTAISR
jgi:hypothetical protein